jgi:sugar/nucleoside kinase (ribokinase family)
MGLGEADTSIRRAMAVTVVGSVALDSLETPFGKRERVLGGAATHFSLAVRFFTDVHVVGVVGEDFEDGDLAVFADRGIGTEDLKRVEGGKSFHWSGRYEDDLSVAHTLATELNVFAEFDPQLSEAARAASTLFLANIQPDLQRGVREQSEAGLTGLDSMNYWIESARGSLVEAMGRVDVVSLNDAEVRMLTGEPNLARGAQAVLELGPWVALVKQGPYGAVMYTKDDFFSIPAYPLETVVDPTGAGDSFAGGFFGFLDSLGEEKPSRDALRAAAVYGSVLGSFVVEDFGTERVQRLTREEIDERFAEFREFMTFEEPSRAHG